MTTESLFLKFSIEKLQEMCTSVEVCLGQLSTEQVWTRGSEHQNAVGNLVLHLSGNVRQWILTGVCGEPDTRARDAEFAARGGHDAVQLAGRLRSAVDEACGRLQSLPHERLLDRMIVQGYDVSKLEGIYHVVEHFSGHAYQIIFVTKAVKDKDLAFYAHLDGTGATGGRQP